MCRGQRWCDGFAEKCCTSSIPDLITLLYDYGWSPGCILMTQAHCCVHESTDTKFSSTTQLSVKTRLQDIWTEGLFQLPPLRCVFLRNLISVEVVCCYDYSISCSQG